MITLTRLFTKNVTRHCLSSSLNRQPFPRVVYPSYKLFSSSFIMSEVADPSSNSNKRAPDSLDEEIDNSAKRPRLISDEDKPMKTASTSAAEDLAMDGSQPTEVDASPESSERPSGQDKNKSNKHDSRKKSRGRGGRRSRNEEDASREVKLSEDGEPIPKAPRYPKRQCALLLGFCGSGYSGMQIQPDHTRTIEGVLFNALVKAGAVSQDNADNPTKVGLARAARTDAGVHAAGNLVSLKMIVTIPGIKDIVAKVNEELPPEIRLWGYVRTQNSFNARLVCDSRKYTYFFPTYLLIPPKPGSGFHRVWSEQAGNIADDKLPLSYEFWNGQDSGTKEEDLARKRAWRVSPGQIQTLRTLAARYEGTHNFHNFTVGREFADRSNNRYMKKIEISDPVVYGETEWISVLFHGQSFMLHQRKMMAILVLACRMGTPMRVISELYGQRDVFVPKMPSLGLLLEEPQFESYNERMVVINSKLQPTDPEFRPLIDFEQYRSQINEFKDEFIYKNMREVEDRDGLFDAWVRTIDTYAGNDLLYLNPTGAVPDAAVIVKGTRRENPFRERRVFDTTSFPAQGDADIKKKLEAAEEDVDEAEEVFDKRQLEETEG